MHRLPIDYRALKALTIKICILCHSYPLLLNHTQAPPFSLSWTAGTPTISEDMEICSLSLPFHAISIYLALFVCSVT